jgi:hypothetical protein
MQKPNIYYICNDVERALGLEKEIPNYHIICIDYNKIVDYMQKEGVNVFCLEQETGKYNQLFRNSNRLLQNKLVQEYIKKTNLNNPNPPHIWVFKIANNIEVTAKNLGYKILNTTTTLNRKFELKLSQYNLLKDANVNFPDTKIAKLGDIRYSDFKYDKLVIQYDRGHTGSSTVFVKNENDFLNEQSKFPKRMARIAKYIEGDSWTINACIGRKGVSFGGLSYQITGWEKCTAMAGGTVGNDWSMRSRLTDKSLDSMKQIIVNVGNKMSEHGFRGLLGLDFVIDKQGDVFLIEVNARQPASTSMHTKLMQMQGLMPLKRIHLEQFEEQIEKEEVLIQDFSVLNASQLIMRNIKESAIEVNTHIPSGVYKVDQNGSFERVRDGWCIDDIRDPDNEVFMLVVDDGHIVSPSGELVRIQTLSNMVESDRYRKLVDKIYQKIYVTD